MITCLLLPPITLNTLAFFMQFLHTVSLNSNSNKMTIENLAIILTPNIMPIAEMIQQRLTSHVKVIQLLIENAHQIGVIPGPLIEKLNDSISTFRHSDTNSSTFHHITTDKKKKKRRSGSLTRMFHGLKKIVGAIGSSESLDRSEGQIDKDASVSVVTPCISKSNKKRKVTDGMPFSAKKKREVLSSLPDNQEILPYTPTAVLKQAKKSRLSLGGYRNKGVKNDSRHMPISSNTSIIENKPMERRWSVVGAPWARKKQNRETSKDQANSTMNDKTVEVDEKDLKGLSPVFSLPNLSTPQHCQNRELFESQIFQRPLLKGKVLFDDDDDKDNIQSTREDFDNDLYLRIPKSEYEAIKKRVSAIETRISQEFNMVMSKAEANKMDSTDPIDRVTDKYHETLQHTEPIEATCSSTDQLAKRLSRELKIRRSSEHKVMRSPSARKIGSIRRRSRESVRLSRNQSWHLGPSTKLISPSKSDLSCYPKTNLKRGRPNTVQSGLKHPEISPVSRGKERMEESIHVGQSVSNEEKLEDTWTCAQTFFQTSDESLEKIIEPSNAHSKLEVFKTPEVINPNRASIKSAGSYKNVTPHFVTKINVGKIKTPMLPPGIPTRKTPAKISMLPSNTPGRLDTSLLKTHLTPLQEFQSGRASIARLRSQNAGMVMAKAKLFDGMVTKTTDKLPTQSAHQQSSDFPLKHNPKANKYRDTPLQASTQLQLRLVHKVRSATNTGNSPQRSTPRKRVCTKSPYGGINRREKLRLAGKSPGVKAIHSPNIIRNIQNNSKMFPTNSNISVSFSPNLYDLDNKTPHAKKKHLRNSPKRLLKTPDGRENMPLHSSDRKHTPKKVTPLSKLALTSRGNNSNADNRTRRESPRLLANSTRIQTTTNVGIDSHSNSLKV
ncbi:uncharacterized protein LOC131440538 isoform X2 [Malaya genurostris]|nr:uncharacterized protein LOC131440538 isoform X2 [Malaya genurostris]